jgi:hypothetical protein
MGWRAAHPVGPIPVRRSAGSAVPQTTNQVWRTIKGIRPSRGRPGGRTIGAHLRVARLYHMKQLIRLAGATLVSVALLLPGVRVSAAQVPSLAATVKLPDAPDPQIPAASPAGSLEAKKKSCPAAKISNGTGVQSGVGTTNGRELVQPQTEQQADSAPCKMTWAKRYDIFVDGPHDKPLTAKDKAWLAARNVADPINNITILVTSAIAVGSDSHSPYGPGMAGWGRNVGVNFTQGLTGEFVGTFLISSIAHQDPHYHRMPNAGIPRRVGHGILQVVWTQGDNGKGMLNYSNLVGFAIEDEISNFYVPGRQTNASATALRYASALAFTPIGNFVTEFVPDVSRHIHVQNVIIQRIINQVARSESPGEP